MWQTLIGSSAKRTHSTWRSAAGWSHSSRQTPQYGDSGRRFWRSSRKRAHSVAWSAVCQSVGCLQVKLSNWNGIDPDRRDCGRSACGDKSCSARVPRRCTPASRSGCDLAAASDRFYSSPCPVRSTTSNASTLPRPAAASQNPLYLELPRFADDEVEVARSASVCWEHEESGQMPRAQRVVDSGDVRRPLAAPGIDSLAAPFLVHCHDPGSVPGSHDMPSSVKSPPTLSPRARIRFSCHSAAHGRSWVSTSA